MIIKGQKNILAFLEESMVKDPNFRSELHTTQVGEEFFLQKSKVPELVNDKLLTAEGITFEVESRLPFSSNDATLSVFFGVENYDDFSYRCKKVSQMLI